MQRRTDSDARRVDGENADCSEARLRGVRRHIGCSRPERLEVANVLVPIQQIVTFATDPFRGNPAFVLMPSSPLPAPILQQLCSHLHEPMIAVVTPKDGGFVTQHFFGWLEHKGEPAEHFHFQSRNGVAFP